MTPTRTLRFRAALLTAVAICIAAIYWVAFTASMWLPTYYSIPHLDTPKLWGLTDRSLWGFVEATALAGALTLGGAWLAWGIRSTGLALTILGLSLVQAVPLVLSYPAGAGDVYAYVAEADTVARFHLNPYVVPAGTIPASPLLPFLDFPAETTHYGPLWEAIGAALRVLSGGDLMAALLAFKMAAVLALLAIALVVYVYVRSERPDAAAAACLLVAWNPLMMLALAEDAHNDAMMMAFVVAALLLQRNGRHTSALAALLAATYVKYVAAIFIPLLLIAWIRRTTWEKGVRTLAIDASLIAIAGATLIGITGFQGSVGILQKMSGDWFTTSPGAVIYLRLLRTVPAPDAAAAVGTMARVAFGAVYAILVAWLWKRPTTLAPVSLLAMLAFLLTVTIWFEPWYVIWVIPIAALVASPPALGAVIGASAGGIAVYATMGFAWRLWWQTADKADVFARGALAMWLPVLGCVLAGAGAGWLLRRRRSRLGVPCGATDANALG